jgi:hypothetical protein
MNRTVLIVLLVLGGMACCLGACVATMYWARAALWESTSPDQPWVKMKAPWGSIDGLRLDPAPLSGESQCWGFQDITCTVVLLYTAADARELLRRNHASLSADAHDLSRSSNADAGNRPVRSFEIEGLPKTEPRGQHHRTDFTRTYIELEDGLVRVELFSMEL